MRPAYWKEASRQKCMANNYTSSFNNIPHISFWSLLAHDAEKLQMRSVQMPHQKQHACHTISLSNNQVHPHSKVTHMKKKKYEEYVSLRANPRPCAGAANAKVRCANTLCQGLQARIGCLDHSFLQAAEDNFLGCAYQILDEVLAGRNVVNERC